MAHGALGAPTGELLSSPVIRGQEQHLLTLNDYGLGVDCHSGFFQICVPGCGEATVQAVATWVNAMTEQSAKALSAPQRLPKPNSADGPHSPAD